MQKFKKKISRKSFVYTEYYRCKFVRYMREWTFVVKICRKSKKNLKKVHIKHQKFELSFCVLYEGNNFWDQIYTLSKKISSEIPYIVTKIRSVIYSAIWGTLNFWTRKSKNIWKNILRKALWNKEKVQIQIRPVYEENNFSEQIDTVSKKISLKKP